MIKTYTYFLKNGLKVPCKFQSLNPFERTISVVVEPPHELAGTRFILHEDEVFCLELHSKSYTIQNRDWYLRDDFEKKLLIESVRRDREKEEIKKAAKTSKSKSSNSTKSKLEKIANALNSQGQDRLNQLKALGLA